MSDAWTFVIAAYALMALGVGVLAALSYAAMRRAEARAAALKSRT